MREGVLLDASSLFASLRVSFLFEHFKLEIQFLEIENLHFILHFARRNVTWCFTFFCKFKSELSSWTFWIEDTIFGNWESSFYTPLCEKKLLHNFCEFRNKLSSWTFWIGDTIFGNWESSFYIPLCEKECCFMIFVSLRVSFLLEHFELEIQFLEIENLE